MSRLLTGHRSGSCLQLSEQAGGSIYDCLRRGWIKRRSPGSQYAKAESHGAKKLGFHTCILPGVSVESVGEVSKMKIIGVKNVSEAIQHL